MPLENKETTTMDKLFLELSQFVSARTNTELKYQELIFHVETKHPGETRHETALRYIKQAENRNNSEAECQQGEVK